MVYELPDDHPLMLAMRRDDPTIKAVGIDDAYVMVVYPTRAVRYAKSPELREALAAYERGEAIEPGTYNLLVPRLKMDETEE